MKNCNSCKNLIPNDSEFCPFCGNKIIKVAEETFAQGEDLHIYQPDVLLKRAFLFIEEGAFDKAYTYIEVVLNQEPENAEAYLAKLLIDLRVKTVGDLSKLEESFADNVNYNRVMRFGDDKTKNTLIEILNSVCDKIRAKETRKKEAIYNEAKKLMLDADSTECGYFLVEEIKDKYFKANQLFNQILNYKDSAKLAEKCQKDVIYRKACFLMQCDSTYDIESAIEKFKELQDWKDSQEKLKECKELLDKTRKRNKKRWEIAGIVSLVLCVIFAIVCTFNFFISRSAKYNEAIYLMNAGKNAKAFSKFIEVANYKDSKDNITQLYKFVDLSDNISSGCGTTVGLKSNGTVVAVGNNDYGQCNVSDWEDIIAVSEGAFFTVGLKLDGTVVSVGAVWDGQDVSKWTNIVAISAGDYHTVGLNFDGTVVADGENDYGQCNVSEWEDIIAISAGGEHTVALKSNGTVVAVGKNGYGQCNVSEWKDIIAISAGADHTVGLKSDGTVVATGRNNDGECNVKRWKNIISIDAGFLVTIGLKSDGTVVAVGNDEDGQLNVSNWKDIVAISSGVGQTIGLKSDGTVIASGFNKYGQCDVLDWENIKTTPRN